MDLPKELMILEIFSRLPFQSLLRCRSVCKSWHSLISDPIFVKTQLRNAINDQTTGIKQIVFSKEQGTDPLTITSIDCQTRSQMVIPTLPFLIPTQNAEILASCNGLLLIGSGEKSHFLWNPSLTSKALEITSRYHFRESTRLYGLGYDLPTDTYKVIRVTRVANLGRHEQTMHATFGVTRSAFYNCKVKTWEKIDPFPYMPFTSAQGVVINWNPHFVVIRRENYSLTECDRRDGSINNKSYVIIYFDAGDEKFKELAKPNWLDNDAQFDFTSLRGMPCLVEHERVQQPTSMKVWAMREYGVRDSWTPMHSIRFIRVHRFVYGILDFGRHYQTMLETEKYEMGFYCINDDDEDALAVFLYHKREHFNIAMYPQTLVSPIDVE